ncbi:DinB family protein [Spirosoma areae]
MDNLQPAAVTGPVTDTERAYAIDYLKTSQANLHQSLSGLSIEQVAYKPDGNRWSVSECVEHIALVERGIFSRILTGMNIPAKPENRASIRVSDIDVIKAVRSRTTALPAPAPFVPTGRFETVDVALKVFDEQRKTAIEFVETTTDDLRTHYFEHFVLGTLDAYQAVLLLASHMERHRKQIDEVKASPGFPK